MKLYSTSALLTVFTLSLVVMYFSGCSGMPEDGMSKVTPSFAYSSDYRDSAPESIITMQNRNLVAIYEAVIDPINQTFKVTPTERNAQFHYPLNQMYPNVLEITGFGFTPNFWADIKLVHPLPGSGVDAFDPRVIAILPDNPGVSFAYPAINIKGNNSVILEPDGYTKLFNNLAPLISGDVNPFIAYFKNEPYRRWSSVGTTEETKTWQMDVNGFAGPLQFHLVVDISTNFPDPPQPVIDNAPEPVALNAVVGPGLTNIGGSANISVTLLDWQGYQSIGGVLVEAPDLFNGVVSLNYSHPGLNSDEYVYTGTITNQNLAPDGNYIYLVASYDDTTSIYIYKEFTLSVNKITQWQWTQTWGGPNNDYAIAVTTDYLGNAYVVGHFYASCEFDPDGGGLETSKGLADAYLSKFNSDGIWQWTRTWGGSNLDEAYSVATDGSADVYVGGSFAGTAEFDPDGGGWISSKGDTDAFLSKFDTNGNWLWTKTWGGTDGDYLSSIAVDLNDNIYAAGSFYNSVEFNPDGGGWQTSNGESDAYLSKFDSNGNWLWTHTWGGTDWDTALSVTVDYWGNQYVSGIFFDTAEFDPDGGGWQSSNGHADAYLSRFDSNGNWQWTKTWGGPSWDYAFSVAVDHYSNAYVTGEFAGTSEFNPDGGGAQTANGFGDAYLSKFDLDGNWQWTKTWGGASTDNGNSISINHYDDIYIAGSFGDIVDFNPDGGNPQSSLGGQDAYLSKFDYDGNWQWTLTWGGTNDLYTHSVATDNIFDNVYVAGYFYGTVEFNPDGGGHQTSSAFADAYLSRFH